MSRKNYMTVYNLDRGLRLAAMTQSWASFGDVVPQCDGGPINLGGRRGHRFDSDQSSLSSRATYEELGIGGDPLELVPWLAGSEFKPPMFSTNLLATPKLFGITTTLPVDSPELTGERRLKEIHSQPAGVMEPFCRQMDQCLRLVNDTFNLSFRAIMSTSKSGEKSAKDMLNEVLKVLEDESLPIQDRLKEFQQATKSAMSKGLQTFDTIPSIVNSYDDDFEKLEFFAPVDRTMFGGNIQVMDTAQAGQLVISMAGTHFNQIALSSCFSDLDFVLHSRLLCSTEPLSGTIHQVVAQPYRSNEPLVGARTDGGAFHVFSVEGESQSSFKLNASSSIFADDAQFGYADFNPYVPGECLLTNSKREMMLFNALKNPDLCMSRVAFPDCSVGNCTRSDVHRKHSDPFRAYFASHPRHYVATERHTMYLGDLRTGKPPALLFEMRSCENMATYSSEIIFNQVKLDDVFGEFFASQLGPGVHCHTVATESHLIVVDQRMPRRIVHSWGHLMHAPPAYLSINRLPTLSTQTRPGHDADCLVLAASQLSGDVLACAVSTTRTPSERPVAIGVPWRIPRVDICSKFVSPSLMDSKTRNSCLSEVPLVGVALAKPDLIGGYGSKLLAPLVMTAQGHMFYQLYSTEERSADFDLSQGVQGRLSSPLDTVIAPSGPSSPFVKLCQLWRDNLEPLQEEDEEKNEEDGSGDDDEDNIESLIQLPPPKMFRPKFRLASKYDVCSDEESGSDFSDGVKEIRFCCQCAAESSVEVGEESTKCTICKVALGDAAKNQNLRGDPPKTFILSRKNRNIEKAMNNILEKLPDLDSLDDFTDSFSRIQRLIWSSEPDVQTGEHAVLQSAEYEAALNERSQWSKPRMADIVTKAVDRVRNPYGMSYLDSKHSSLIPSELISMETPSSSVVWNPNEIDQNLIDRIGALKQENVEFFPSESDSEGESGEQEGEDEPEDDGTPSTSGRLGTSAVEAGREAQGLDKLAEAAKQPQIRVDPDSGNVVVERELDFMEY